MPYYPPPSGGGNSFGVVNPPAGTDPTAATPTATLNITTSDGTITATGNSGTNTVDLISPNRFLAFRDQKTAGTDGGTFTSGAWRTRDITHINDNSTGITLGTNQLVIPAGTYFIYAQLPAFNVPNRHVGRLQDVTNAVTLVDGQNCSSEGSGPFTFAIVCGIFTLASQATVEVQHRCQTTVTTIGFGRSVATTLSATYDIYSAGYIVKLL